MISGEIRARRSRPAMRFAEHNFITGRMILIGLLVEIVFFLPATMSFHWGPLHQAFWSISAYFFGLVVPLLIAVEIVLGLLALWEKFAKIPSCRNCKARMKHQSRVSRLENTKGTWTHASSDCLAALKENLWEDAAKLLPIHGKFSSPGLDEESAQPLTSDASIRYHLDFFYCRWCGDECAVLSTEDRSRQTWNARKEYNGAYKQAQGLGIKLSRYDCLLETLGAVGRAVQLATEPIRMTEIAIPLLPALLFALFFCPQIPQLLRPSGYMASITIASDPAGPFVVVDGVPITTPKTFTWYYGSIHTLSGFTNRQLDGNLYQFQEIKPRVHDYKQNARPIWIDMPGREWWSAFTIDTKSNKLGMHVDQPVASVYGHVQESLASRGRGQKVPYHHPNLPRKLLARLV